MDIPYFVYPFIWVVFLNLATMNKAATKKLTWRSLCEQVSLFLGKVPRSGIAGSYGNSTFNFVRNLLLSKQLYYFTFQPAVS